MHGQRLQELLTRIQWDEGAFNGQRVQQMAAQVRQGKGALVLDDTGFGKQGTLFGCDSCLRGLFQA